tara:strand:- start:102 stop:872 length:771 start_codon:yes stop_codon:yes gene_type:complete
MKNFIFALLLFLSLKIPHVLSQSLDKGYFVSGTLKNLYNQKINITLPDGEWEVTDSYEEDSYQHIELYSSIYDSWAFIYIPLTKLNGELWAGGGMEKCKGKDVFLSLVERGNPEATVCFEDEIIDGDEWSVAKMNVRTNNTPLKWVSLSFYIPKDRIKSSISEYQFKNTGKKVLKALKRAINGGDSSDMANLSEFLVSNSSETFVQDFDSNYETNYSSNADKGVAEKLRDLKSMLDEGLISQDQYDEKSSKILDDF